MARQKWYVVTVGKGVGVFPTWLEAAPLVKGVPEAIYQSFPSEGEARRLFAQEMLKGTTKVIRDDGQVQFIRQQLTPTSTPNRNISHLNGSLNIRSSSFTSPSLSNTQGYLSRNSNHQNATNRTGSRSESSHHVGSRSGTFSPRHSQRPLESASPLSRSGFEPSSSFILEQKIEMLFQEPLPVFRVQASAASHERTPQGLTSKTSLREFNAFEFSSPNSCSPHQPESVIVKTPDWLKSYPQSCQPRSRPLSPLNNEDIALDSFAPLSMGPDRAANTRQLEATSSVVDSSMYLSPSPRQIKKAVHQYNVDPRSPIKNKFQVPELEYGSCLSFSRPTPRPKRAIKLPNEGLEVNGTPQSSVLFQSGPSSF